MANDPSDRQYKIVIIGDGAVGKTTLLIRHLKSHFEPNTKPTVGVDLKVDQITDKELYEAAGVKSATGITSVSEEENHYQYWDLGGQEMFDQLRQAYFQGSNGIMLCFSLNDDRSFSGTSADGVDHSIGRFLKQLINFFGKEAVRKIPMLIVGTKNDLERNMSELYINKVTELLKKGGLNLISYNRDYDSLVVCGHWSTGREKFLREEATQWVTTSAKTGDNVDLVFKLIEIAVKEQQRADEDTTRNLVSTRDDKIDTKRKIDRARRDPRYRPRF